MVKTKFRLVLDFIVVTVLLLTATVGCVNGQTEPVETDSSIPLASSVSDVSETEVTTTSETTTETTKEVFTPDPTYEEAAAHVRDLLAEGNSAEEVIAILVDEGRTEFDATTLVNSVLLEDEGTVGGGSGTSSEISSGSSNTGSNNNNGGSSSGGTSNSTGSGSSTCTGTSSGTSSGGSTTTTTSTQVTSSGGTTATTETTVAPTATSSTTISSQVPTKVKQTIYMRIVWDDQDIEAMAAQGIDLNVERPEAVGVAIYACDENGNYNAGSVIDRTDFDAAEAQMYAEADAIVAKYNLQWGYSYTAYKIENEYVYN